MRIFIQSTYNIGKKLVIVFKISSLCALLDSIKINMVKKLYHDEFFPKYFIYMFSILQNKVMN